MSDEEQTEAAKKATAVVLAHLDRTFTSENSDARVGLAPQRTMPCAPSLAASRRVRGLAK